MARFLKLETGTRTSRMLQERHSTCCLEPIPNLRISELAVEELRTRFAIDSREFAPDARSDKKISHATILRAALNTLFTVQALVSDVLARRTDQWQDYASLPEDRERHFARLRNLRRPPSPNAKYLQQVSDIFVDWAQNELSSLIAHEFVIGQFCGETFKETKQRINCADKIARRHTYQAHEELIARAWRRISRLLVATYVSDCRNANLASDRGMDCNLQEDSRLFDIFSNVLAGRFANFTTCRDTFAGEGAVKSKIVGRETVAWKMFQLFIGFDEECNGHFPDHLSISRHIGDWIIQFCSQLGTQTADTIGKRWPTFSNAQYTSQDVYVLSKNDVDEFASDVQIQDVHRAQAIHFLFAKQYLVRKYGSRAKKRASDIPGSARRSVNEKEFFGAKEEDTDSILLDLAISRSLKRKANESDSTEVSTPVDILASQNASAIDYFELREELEVFIANCVTERVHSHLVDAKITLIVGRKELLVSGFNFAAHWTRLPVPTVACLGATEFGQLAD
ncbi:hypothetical protein Enr13x_23740 [Stieleria neptunia]|uniref:Uncharacterized protein n=1 Tax=Stieleria neptunia TaxID=2527979 RepID=A0A518HNV6_9BACT|nr:hypothetical protein Enr13x_23740 [Stieleria neptunia]